MGITRLHNFEHRNKAYFKVFKVEYVKLFVLKKSHKQMFFLCVIVIISQLRCFLTFAGQSFNILIVLRASGLKATSSEA